MRGEKEAKTLMVARLEELIHYAGGRATAADIMGITPKTLTEWKNQPDKIRMVTAARLAKYAGRDLKWLMEGDTNRPIRSEREIREKDSQSAYLAETNLSPKLGANVAPDIVYIPLYDASLSAGEGRLIDRFDIIEQVPVSIDILRHIGVSDRSDIGFFPVAGDSMEPTASDGSIAMVNLRNQYLTEGIFAIEFDGEARIKRLRKRITGEIEIISDNDFYEDEVLSGQDLNLLTVVGRVVWLAKRV